MRCATRGFRGERESDGDEWRSVRFVASADACVAANEACVGPKQSVDAKATTRKPTDALFVPSNIIEIAGEISGVERG